MQTLVLTQGWQPHRVVSWKRAVTMLFDGKVEVIAEYDDVVRSVTLAIRMPAVVRLLRALRGRTPQVRFSRVNVLTRDQFTCQYCGRKAEVKELTFDHVLPRSRGGRTDWDNIVTACRPCNSRKGSRTPAEAKMTLRTQPKKPKFLPHATVRVDLGRSIPDAWASFVYWNVPLETD